MSMYSGVEFRQVDVFTKQALSGNGLAVFMECEGFSAEVMQALTLEMRQYESIFLSERQGRSFRARIFTVEEELDFAGHPVLGAAAVLHEQSGEAGAVEWTCKLNTKQVRIRTVPESGGFHAAMDQGRPEFGSVVQDRDAGFFLQALNINEGQVPPGYPLQVVSTGLPYLLIPVAGGLETVRPGGVDIGEKLHALGADFAYIMDVQGREGRTWDNAGVLEDAATGSAAGPVGAYLVKYGAAGIDEEILLRQGSFVQRPSEILIRVQGSQEAPENVIVSGSVRPVARGTFD